MTKMESGNGSRTTYLAASPRLWDKGRRGRCAECKQHHLLEPAAWSAPSPLACFSDMASVRILLKVHRNEKAL